MPNISDIGWYLDLIECRFVLVFCLWSYIPKPPLHLFWGSWVGPLPYRIEPNFLNRGPILLTCGLLHFWVWYGMICVRQTGRGQGTRVLPTKHGETVRDQDTRTPCPYQCFNFTSSWISNLILALFFFFVVLLFNTATCHLPRVGGPSGWTVKPTWNDAQRPKFVQIQ